MNVRWSRAQRSRAQTFVQRAVAPDTIAPEPPAPTERRTVLWRLPLGGDEPERVIALLLLGCCIEIFYALLLNRFLLTLFFPGPGMSIGFPQMMSGNWAADAKWLSIVLVAPFAPFAVALWYVRGLRGPATRLVIFGVALLFGLTLVGLYPITAADLFHYVADARTLFLFHQNPMLVAPSVHGYFIGISWEEQPSPYGPFWQIISQVPIAITADGAVASVIAFKLLALVAYIACADLVYAIVRRTWPERALLATLAFAWNPFIVFRAVGDGHNDIVMMAFALGGFYFVARRQWLVALPLLALSLCLKFSTALLVPPVLIYAWRVCDHRERRLLAAGAGAALLITVLVFAPFWAGADTFQTFVQNANMTISSVPPLASLELQALGAVANPDHLVKFAGDGAFLIVYAAILLGIYRAPTYRALVSGGALAFIAYLVLATWWFRPWYFLWFLALAALVPSYWWIAVGFATCLGSTFFDIVEQYRDNWSWIASNGFRDYAAPVVLAFVPLLLALFLAMGFTGAWTLSPTDTPSVLDDA